jgi:hypothetical protein
VALARRIVSGPGAITIHPNLGLPRARLHVYVQLAGVATTQLLRTAKDVPTGPTPMRKERHMSVFVHDASHAVRSPSDLPGASPIRRIAGDATVGHAFWSSPHRLTALGMA